jgi:hypothetical protein
MAGRNAPTASSTHSRIETGSTAPIDISRARNSRVWICSSMRAAAVFIISTRVRAFSGSARSASSSSQLVRIAVNGVRSSWLALAVNSCSRWIMRARRPR